MFHEIPELIKKRMNYLEELDKEDRVDGTSRMKRLRQIPPETGKFISILAASSPKGEMLEIGTSGGYSAL
ncbi:MAG: O-methyltransferase, partial [Promethearchaeota archaeon]